MDAEVGVLTLVGKNILVIHLMTQLWLKLSCHDCTSIDRRTVKAVKMDNG
jgi:hypothetical protein